MNDQIRVLNAMVRGSYDFQQLRVQAGLRLVANFRAKLMPETLAPSDNPDDTSSEEEGKLTVEAEDIIKQLKENHKRLTDGVARNRMLPAAKGFKGNEVISTFAELALADEYFKLDAEEGRQFRLLEGVLEDIPIYNQYLLKVRGVGPAMAAVMISRFDPAKARHVSSFWKFAGLDVAPDGAGRSRRKEHLVEREYQDKAGDTKTRMSVTFDPWLKTKLVGVLAGSFLRSGSPWAEVYRWYKHRIETDPARIKVSSAEYSKRFKAKATKEELMKLWTPKRIHAAASRYMIKMFLAQFWSEWRKLEGLEVTPTYHEAKQGHVHGADGNGPPIPPLAIAKAA